jgi:hypothetical protein
MFIVSCDGSWPRVDREYVGTSIKGGKVVGLREWACQSSGSSPYS